MWFVPPLTQISSTCLGKAFVFLQRGRAAFVKRIGCFVSSHTHLNAVLNDAPVNDTVCSSRRRHALVPSVGPSEDAGREWAPAALLPVPPPTPRAALTADETTPGRPLLNTPPLAGVVSGCRPWSPSWNWPCFRLGGLPSSARG